jgi:GTP cyclohydrolase I
LKLKNSDTGLDLNQAIFNVTQMDYAKMAGELILKSVGENPQREGLLNTPQRFSKAIHEVCSGYLMTPADAVGEGIFPGEGAGLISIRDIDFFSLCEHHMLPFWGRASVAYYPSDKIIGLSKIPRLVDVFAKRLQVQERLTDQICSGLMTLIGARAVLVKVSGSHMCMMMRGVKKNGSETITESSRGLDNLTPDEKLRLWKSID